MSDRLFLLERHGQITKFVARQPFQLTEQQLRDKFPSIPADEKDIVAYLNKHCSKQLTSFFEELEDDYELDAIEDPKGKADPEWDDCASIQEDDGDSWRYCFDPVEVED